MAEVVTRTSGYYRGRESGAIAAGGSLLAYVVAWQAVPLLYAHTHLGSNWVTLQFVFGVVAAVVAYRRVAVTSGARGCRRARRVVAGGIVGGAVVLARPRAASANRSSPLPRRAIRSPRSRTRPATARPRAPERRRRQASG